MTNWDCWRISFFRGCLFQVVLLDKLLQDRRGDYQLSILAWGGVAMKVDSQPALTTGGPQNDQFSTEAAIHQHWLMFCVMRSMRTDFPDSYYDGQH
jgi:hypothetical protein